MISSQGLCVGEGYSHNFSIVSNDVNKTKTIIPQYMRHKLSTQYVCTDKFHVFTYLYVDRHTSKCILHGLSCDMGFLGTFVQIQSSSFRLRLDSDTCAEKNPPHTPNNAICIYTNPAYTWAAAVAAAVAGI